MNATSLSWVLVESIIRFNVLIATTLTSEFSYLERDNNQKENSTDRFKPERRVLKDQL